MQVPVDVDQPNVLLDDAAHGTLRKPTASIVEKDRLSARISVTICPVKLSQELLPHWPIFFERLLGFGSIRNDAFLVAFASHAQDAFFLLDIEQIQAGKLADAQARSIKKFEQ